MVVISVIDKDAKPIETRFVKGARVDWVRKQVHWTYNGANFDFICFSKCEIVVVKSPAMITVTKE